MSGQFGLSKEAREKILKILEDEKAWELDNAYDVMIYLKSEGEEKCFVAYD